ncbi:MAG: cytochrome c [Sterolibacterium sp.]
MIHSTIRATALVFGGLLFSSMAFADTDTNPTPTASPATTQATANSIQSSERCAASGSRVISGSYDPITGALNTTTTLSACVIRNGDKFDGTDTTAGTLLATATGFTIDITSTVNTAIVRADGSTVTRACTSTKKGTYTSATQTFDGTTAKSNCSVTGKVLEHENVIEHLLRAATGDDEGGGDDTNKRVIPPRADEDHIKHRSDTSDDDDLQPSSTTPQPPTTTPPVSSLTNQTITFVSPGAQIVGVPVTLSASADSGLAVTLASTTPAVCTLSGNTLTAVAAGNCTMTATQAGNTTYAAAATVSRTIAVTNPAAAVSATNGKTLYAGNCGSCHGAVPSLMNVLAGANNAAAIQSAINGNIGGMGTLSRLISQELADIAAYLATPML